MRNLRLYMTDIEFKTYEEFCGGDGLATESIVPGVSMSKDIRKRYFNPHDETILTHTLTINYKTKNGTVLAPATTKSIKYIEGVTSEIVVTPKAVDGYECKEVSKTVTIPDDTSVDFIYKVVVDYSEPLTFEIICGGTINWKAVTNQYPATIKYNKNNSGWIEITSTETGTPIDVSEGDVVMFAGSGNLQTLIYRANYFGDTTATFNVRGNIMSLCSENDFATMTVIPNKVCFGYLFKNCTNLLDASNLILPATALTDECYRSMFENCTNLNGAPELPSEEMKYACYSGMFYSCRTLVEAPELPATRLSNLCYAAMFHNCRSLVEAPELPATSVANSCYSYMFTSCKSITRAPMLPATNLYGVVNNSAYGHMFDGCSNLSYINCPLTGDVPTFSSWVVGVASAGTFVVNDDSFWNIGNNGIPSGWTVVNSDGKQAPQFTCLTLDITSSGKINWLVNTSQNLYKSVLNYSLDNGETWTSMSSSTAPGASFNVSAGDKVLLKCDMHNGSYSYYSSFSGTTAGFKVYGNISSVATSGNSFAAVSAIPSYECEHLFEGCTGLTDASGLYLGHKVFYYGALNNLFNGCSSLVSGPKTIGLSSATTMCGETCANMFMNCVNLERAPELPSENLSSSAYSYMFYSCKKLSDIPSRLPAKTLKSGCYNYMFYGCYGLTGVPANYLPATTLAEGCYSGMFSNCTGLTSIPNLPAETLANRCYSEMFYRCNSLTGVPANYLPATTLAASCYTSMFLYCTALTQVPDLPAETLATGCYAAMFRSCESLTGVPANYLPATTLATACYSGMFLSCRVLTQVPDLPATTLAASCYRAMFSYCYSLTNAPNLPAETLANYCYSGMFQSCSSMTVAPELKAETLVTGCYGGMFYGCKSLNYIKCLAKNVSASNCKNNWVSSVSSSGTFVKSPDITTETWSTGTSGIPAGWTVQDAAA